MKEKSLECWARRSTSFFTKKAKRMVYEEVDNMVWNDGESEIARWCRSNKVYDEITEEEIEKIWKRESPDEETVRLNGKYVWETANRVCDFINTHEDLIRITSFGDYRVVMNKIMRVIKEAHIMEKKKRQTSRKKRSDEIKENSTCKIIDRHGEKRRNEQRRY